MGAETTAALAALVVAVMAMIVASAQAIQQYFVTGQLIRMCDSVVYGQMPGQGQRVWQLSQFRFRVVYSIPQISLRPSLWSNDHQYQQSYLKGHLALPDLRHPIRQENGNFRKALSGHVPLRQRQSAYTAIPGEAPWVSFCRTVQYASGNDIFYELLDGDADRCPSDLSVVPMQVSMRDIVTLALMAGMRCTDASFEKKSLAMDGPAGTIASSWHPILGTIIRFTPRNSSQPQGLRIGNGSVSPQWMARMWDVVIVAGRSYSPRERGYYEVYEGYDWVTPSRDRTVAKLQARKPSSRRSSTSTRFYRRRSSGAFRRFSASVDSAVDLGTPSDGLQSEPGHLTANGIAVIHPNRHDGVWCFEPDSGDPKALGGPECGSNVSRNGSQAPDDKQSGGWREQWRKRFSRYRQNRQPGLDNAGLDSYSMDVEGGGTKEKAADYTSKTSHDRQTHFTSKPEVIPANLRSRLHLQPARRPEISVRQTGRKMLDGRALQQYIAEKKTSPPGSSHQEQLFLTWPAAETEVDEGQETEATEGDSTAQDDRENSYFWEMKRERSLSYRQQWRNIVRSRSRLREERDAEGGGIVYPAKVGLHRTSRRHYTRSDTYPPFGGRSLSMESRTSGRRKYSRTGYGKSQQRGRPRVKEDADGFHMRQTRSVELGSDESSRERNRESDNTSQIGSQIAYGNSPVPVFRDQNNAETENQDIVDDDTWTEKRKQNRVVGFQLDKGRADPPSTPSERNSSMTNHISINNDSSSELLTDGSPSHNILETHKSLEPSRNIASAQLEPGSTVPTLLESENRSHERTTQPDRDHDRAESRQREVEGSKGILKRPRDQFPEEADPYREGIAHLKDTSKEGIPKGARWTKINRLLVSPSALEAGGERFEERKDYVVVLRVLRREEIENYAKKTKELREARERRRRKAHGKSSLTIEGEGSKPRLKDQGPSTSWSNGSTLGSSVDLRLSESPSRISDEDSWGEAVVVRRRANAPRHREDSGSSNTSRMPIYRRRHRTERHTISRSPPPYRSSRRTLEEMASDNGSSDDDVMSLVSSSDDTTFKDEPLLDRDRRLSSQSDFQLMNSNLRDARSLQSAGEMNWLWICQADVQPGYFVTPWQRCFSESVCLGAIATMLEVLQHFTNPTTLTFVEKYPRCEDWIDQGRSTHPSYAINAMGGIIVSGRYRRTQFDCLQTRIPPIELLRSYEYQVNRTPSFGTTPSSPVEQLGELMSLDSWLAFCGRLSEICDGRSNLLRRMPALIQKIMTDFDYEFRILDRMANEGGLQIIQEMAMLVLRELEREHLSDAEQLFTAVAILRSAKMALGVIRGPSTVKLREILLEDVQVYLV